MTKLHVHQGVDFLSAALKVNVVNLLNWTTGLMK